MYIGSNFKSMVKGTTKMTKKKTIYSFDEILAGFKSNSTQ